MEERLQKFLSNAGIASRRRAEDLITKGLVRINGNVASLGDKLDPAKDQVTYAGHLVRPTAEMYYIAVNKPKGYITSRRDPEGRRSVYDLVPKDIRPKVWSVGRLDFFSEGLMIFTNDGELTQTLAHPKYEHDKEYEVVPNRVPTGDQLAKLREGVTIGNGDLTSPAKVKLKLGKVYMTIHEGKKRQIRRMFQAVGLKVANLKRIRENKLELGDLEVGKWKYVKKEDII